MELLTQAIGKKVDKEDGKGLSRAIKASIISNILKNYISYILTVFEYAIRLDMMSRNP